jgi:hypothetical protein
LKRGRKSRALRFDQVKALRELQRRERLTIPALAKRLGVNWRALGSALRGHRVWELTADAIGAWLEQHAAAPAETKEPGEETEETEARVARRGSR